MSGFWDSLAVYAFPVKLNFVNAQLTGRLFRVAVLKLYTKVAVQNKFLCGQALPLTLLSAFPHYAPAH